MIAVLQRSSRPSRPPPSRARGSIRDWFRANLSAHPVRDGCLAMVAYALLLPFGLLDLFVSIFQRISFPVWGIERVMRSDHVVIDRHKLAYLSDIQKLNCVYCGYANGVISYTREVAARTEVYWCPIKHARPVVDPHDHYDDFWEYGDTSGWPRNFHR